MIPLHLGGLHPIEQWLVVGIAFAPFVVLGFVVFFVRRRDVREEEATNALLADREITPDRSTSPGQSRLAP